jgi:hypothetical protein
MARRRGIEGASLGYFSPTVLELLVLRSHTELEALGAEPYPADVAQHTIAALAEFEYINSEWHIDGPAPKSTPSNILEIHHPVQRKLILNPYMTQPTSKIVLGECRNVSAASYLEDFVQSTGDIVFFQYRYAIRIVLGPTFSNPPDALEVKCYRQIHALLQELAISKPDTLYRAWPYTFSKLLPDGTMETYFVIFCGKGTDVVDEEEA